MKVLIYSNEHEAWWRDNYCGYTTKQEKAGVFDYEKAHKCYPTIGFNRQDEDYFVRLDDENNMQETKLTPLETFELLCQSYVDDINTLKHKDIEKDYFYNEKYDATITDIKTGRSGKTADIETALKRNIELEFENSKQFKEKWVQDKLAMTFELNVANSKLKALEIIKEYFILTSEYGKVSFELKKEIPEDKYNSLKEMLL